MSAKRTGRARGGARAVFGVPLAVGLATLAGLLAALLHEGAGWVVAWAALSLPLALIAWHVGRAYLGRVRPGKTRPGKTGPGKDLAGMELGGKDLAGTGSAPRNRVPRRT